MEQEAGRKSLFSRLADVIFEETEAATEHQAEIPADRKSPDMVGEKISAEDETLLREILAEVESQGKLLKQFMDLTASLAEIIPQEAACFQAALKALEKTSAAKKADLMADADRQLSALDREKKGFEQSIGKKTQAIQAISQKAEAVRARINELQTTIQTLGQEEQQLYAEMANEERLVRTAQVRFDSITRMVERDIRLQLEKIKNYLPEEAAKGKGAK